LFDLVLSLHSDSLLFSWRKNYPRLIMAGVRVATFYELPGIVQEEVDTSQQSVWRWESIVLPETHLVDDFNCPITVRDEVLCRHLYDIRLEDCEINRVHRAPEHRVSLEETRGNGGLTITTSNEGWKRQLGFCKYRLVVDRYHPLTIAVNARTKLSYTRPGRERNWFGLSAGETARTSEQKNRAGRESKAANNGHVVNSCCGILHLSPYRDCHLDHTTSPMRFRKD
jgi:hypothetical protein